MAEVSGNAVQKQLRVAIDAQHKVQQAARDAAAQVRTSEQPAPPAEPKK